MKEAALVAIAAAIGNFLQGWDNACIAGTFPSSNYQFLVSSRKKIPIPFFGSLNLLLVRTDVDLILPK